VLARIVNMRGVNLNTFDFDYDLTWYGFFLNSRQHIYGRYGGRDGGRDGGPAEKGLSLKGLKYAMRAALAEHRRNPKAAPAAPVTPARTVEQYSTAPSPEKQKCIHCHQVYDYHRAELRARRNWSRDDVWVYPPPGNVGLVLELDQGDRVKSVELGSIAAKAGLRPGDVLKRLGEFSTASFGDVQYALHRGPKSGELAIAWERAGQARSGSLELPAGWRESDISWRASMWTLSPPASVWGDDLTAAEKKALGLSEKSLAFKQGDYVPPPAQGAGIRAGDIILGIDGKRVEMTMLQFNVYIRLNFQPGDKITYNVFRKGKRLDFPMTLTEKE
jgi:serine protease Do